MDNFQIRSILSMRFLAYVKISIFLLTSLIISLPSAAMADSTFALLANVNSGSINSELFCIPILSTIGEITDNSNTNIEKYPSNDDSFLKNLERRWERISFELNKTQIGSAIVIILDIIFVFLFFYVFLYHPCRRLYDYLCVYDILFEGLQGRFMLFTCLYFIGLCTIFGGLGPYLGDYYFKYLIGGYAIFCICFAIYDLISFIHTKILIYNMKKSKSRDEESE